MSKEERLKAMVLEQRKLYRLAFEDFLNQNGTWHEHLMQLQCAALRDLQRAILQSE